jgi:hypothetical protein
MPPPYNKTHHADLLVLVWPLRTSCWPLSSVALVEGGEEVQPVPSPVAAQRASVGREATYRQCGGDVLDVRFRPRFSCTTSTGSRRSC